MAGSVIDISNTAGAKGPIGVPSRWRRHVAAGVFIGCLVGSAVLLGALRMPRIYRATVVLDRHVVLSSSPIAVAPILDSTTSDLQKIIGATPLGRRTTDAVQIAESPGEAGRDRITLALRTTEPDDAVAMLSTILVTYQQQTQKTVSAQLLQQAHAIDTRVAAAAAAATQAQDQLQKFETDHPGVTGEDPAGRAATLERINTRIDDRTQQAQLLDQQIASLGGTATPTPAPAPNTPPAPPAINVEADPEVMALRAQASLLSDQLKEQTETLHRTEQHPYVIELRGRQAELQKKLDAALARAAAGQPAPEGVKAPTETPGAAAAQMQQAQLKQLQAQRAALGDQIADLQKQRDALQKGGDDGAGLRRMAGQLQAASTAAEKDLADARTDQRTFANQYNVNDDAGVATAAASIIDFGHPFPGADLYTPVSPQFSTVLVAALIGGVMAGLVSAGLGAMLDHKLHGPNDVRAVVDAPVLGIVRRYNTNGSPKASLTFLGPLLALASVVLLIGSAVLAYGGLTGKRIGDAVTEASGMTGVTLAQEGRP
jgi:uncharacterized protein involved in exopolysaccharide biosynthesis